MQMLPGSNHEHEVRDCLSRIMRVEHSLSSMVVIQNNSTSAQYLQSDALIDLQRTLAAVAAQQQEMMLILKTNAASMANAAPAPQPAPDSPSPEIGNAKICPFTDCPAVSPKGCSSTMSLRHMEVCTFCPANECRNLRIARHMLLFQKHPRVTDFDVCCWCGLNWKPDASADSRSKHRRRCHQVAIGRLQDPCTCDDMSLLLSRSWNTYASPTKRARNVETTHIPFSPPCSNAQDVEAALSDNGLGLVTLSFSDDDDEMPGPSLEIGVFGLGACDLLGSDTTFQDLRNT
jgi:hypothetical protein